MDTVTIDTIGNTTFDSFHGLLRDRFEELKEEESARSINIDKHIKALNVLADLTQAIFRLVERMDDLIGHRSEASKKLLVKLYEAVRDPFSTNAITPAFVNGIERYFLFTTADMARKLKRNLTQEEMKYLEKSISVMVGDV